MSEAALKELENPTEILEHCLSLNPSDEEYSKHPIIERFGSPKQPIYVDQCKNVSKRPLNPMPIF